MVRIVYKVRDDEYVDELHLVQKGPKEWVAEKYHKGELVGKNECPELWTSDLRLEKFYRSLGWDIVIDRVEEG